MNNDTKIKYTFHNEIGETVEMTFTIMQIECMTGGFMNWVLEELNDMGFGKPTEVYRIMVM